MMRNRNVKTDQSASTKDLSGHGVKVTDTFCNNTRVKQSSRKVKSPRVPACVRKSKIERPDNETIASSTTETVAENFPCKPLHGCPEIVDYNLFSSPVRDDKTLKRQVKTASITSNKDIPVLSSDLENREELEKDRDTPILEKEVNPTIKDDINDHCIGRKLCVYRNISEILSVLKPCNSENRTPIVCLTNVKDIKILNMKKGSQKDSSPARAKGPTKESKASDSKSITNKILHQVKETGKRSPRRQSPGKVTEQIGSTNNKIKAKTIAKDADSLKTPSCSENAAELDKAELKSESEECIAEKETAGNAVNKKGRKSRKSVKEGDKDKNVVKERKVSASKSPKKDKAIPDIAVTPPKGKPKHCPKNSPSPKKNKNNKNMGSPNQPEAETLVTKAKKARTPSKSPSPSRKKKTLIASPSVKSHSFKSLKLEIPESGLETLKATGCAQSPKAKLKEDNSTKKTPKKSPSGKIDALLTPDSSQMSSSSNITSSPEAALSDGNTSQESLNKSPVRKRKPQVKKDSLSSSPQKDNKSVHKLDLEQGSGEENNASDIQKSRVPLFGDDITLIKSLETPLPSNFKYKYSYVKESCGPIGLSDLISKVSSSIKETDPNLNDLFGTAEEPEFSDDGVVDSPTESDKQTNDSLDSDKTVTEFNVTTDLSSCNENVDDKIEDAIMETNSGVSDDKKEIESETNEKVFDLRISDVEMDIDDNKNSSCLDEDKNTANIADKENVKKGKSCESQLCVDENTSIENEEGSKKDAVYDKKMKEICSNKEKETTIFEYFGLNLKKKSKTELIGKTDPQLEPSCSKGEKSIVDGNDDKNTQKDNKSSQGNDIKGSANRNTADIKLTDISDDDDYTKQKERVTKVKNKAEVIDLVEENDIDEEDDDLIFVPEVKASAVVISDDESSKPEVEIDLIKNLLKKPKFYSVNNIVEPKPLDILANAEKDVKDKKNAFVSDELEKYLEVHKENINIDLVYRKLNSLGDNSSHASVKQQLSNAEPDFDEVDGHIFMSFPTEQVLKAHVQLESTIDWLNEASLRKMAHLKSMKERQQDTGTRRLTDVKSSDEQKQNFRGIPMRLIKYQKMLKQELEDILTGRPKRTPENLLTKTPEKTSDITKIKGWKSKFQNPEELQEATGLHFSESGKLHWRTEERLLKNLDPDDVKDMGLELKKKRRKLINYSNRKKSCPKTEAKVETEEEDEEEEEEKEEMEYDEEYDGIITERDVYNEDDEKPTPDKIPYMVKYHSQHKYGARKMFVKKMGLDAKDEMILKKLGTQKLITMNDTEGDGEAKRTSCRNRKGKPVTVFNLSKLSQSMAVAAVSALDRRLISRARTLAKNEERRREKQQKLKGSVVHIKEEIIETVDEPDNDYMDEESFVDRKEKEDEETGSEDEDYGAVKVRKIPVKPTVPPVLSNTPKTRSMMKPAAVEEAAAKSDEKAQEGKTKENKTGERISCDKPGGRVDIHNHLKGSRFGCRYGCICHLCKFSDSGEEKIEAEVKPPCDKEYCRLGCICDSIDVKMEEETHCQKPGCMLECKCRPKQPKPDIPKERESRSKKKRKAKGSKKKRHDSEPKEEASSLPKDEGNVTAEDTEDWEPPSKRKRAPNSNRFANLPRRETTYRVAKNLDAVSRKAMEVYVSSEMYAEQKIRRRKSDQGLDFLDGEFPGPSQSIVGDQSKMTGSKLDFGKSNEGAGEKNDETCSRLNTETGVFEISDESSDSETFPDDVFSCARITPYQGQYFRKLKDKVTEKTNRKKPSNPDVIDLDTDNEDNSSNNRDQDSKSNLPSGSGMSHACSSKMTLTEKMGLANRKKPSVKNENAKWKTQMVCLKAKKKSEDKDQDTQSEIKLLEIISNCNWENDRTNMLSKISHIISKDCPTNHIIMWSGYVLQFLPKADKPAVIPPELQSKLPVSMYSIRVRVTQNITDIEQAENETKEEAAEKLAEEAEEEEDKEEEINKKLSDEKTKTANVILQKKLIDKIKFAERLRDLIIAEEKKGVSSSKFSVSREGIEKALKRYKTQLWKAYTGSSNMTLIQLKQAVQAAKSKNSEKVPHTLKAVEDPDNASSGKPVTGTSAGTIAVEPATTSCLMTPSTLARIQANQGLKVICQNVPQTLSQHGFFSLNSLQSSSVVTVSPNISRPVNVSTSITSSNELNADNAESKGATQSSATTSTVTGAQSVVMTPKVAKTHSGVSLQSDSTSVCNSFSTSQSQGGPHSEVLLIPVPESSNGAKWDPSANPVLSAKMTMLPNMETGSMIGQSGIMRSATQTHTIIGQPQVPMQLLKPWEQPSSKKLSKPVLNPAFSALANSSQKLNGQQFVLQSSQPGSNQIMINSIQPILSGSPAFNKVQTIISKQAVIGQQIRFGQVQFNPANPLNTQLNSSLPQTGPPPLAGPMNVPITKVTSSGSCTTIPPLGGLVPCFPPKGPLTVLNAFNPVMNGPKNGILPTDSSAASKLSSVRFQFGAGMVEISKQNLTSSVAHKIIPVTSNSVSQSVTGQAGTYKMLQSTPSSLIRLLPLTTTSSISTPISSSDVSVITTPHCDLTFPNSTLLRPKSPIIPIVTNLNPSLIVKYSGGKSLLPKISDVKEQEDKSSVKTETECRKEIKRSKRNQQVNEVKTLFNEVKNGDHSKSVVSKSAEVCGTTGKNVVNSSGNDKLKEEIESEITKLVSYDSDGNSDLDSLGSSVKSFASLGDVIKSSEICEKDLEGKMNSRKSPLDYVCINECESIDIQVGEIFDNARFEIAKAIGQTDELQYKCERNKMIEAIAEVDKGDDITEDSDSCVLTDENYVCRVKKPQISSTQAEPSIHSTSVIGQQMMRDIEMFNRLSKKKLKRNVKDCSEDERPKKKAKTDSCIEIDDSEGSDIDIMTFGDGDEIIKLREDEANKASAPVQQSRRKSLLTSLDHCDDFEIQKVRKDRKAEPVKPVPIFSFDHLGKLGKTAAERNRRINMRRLFANLQSIVYKYNPKMQNLNTTGIPKALILDETLKLLNALKHKMNGLKECLEDGRQYQRALETTLQDHIDSFVRSGVPENIIKNFLKSVARATLHEESRQNKSPEPSVAEETETNQELKCLWIADETKEKSQQGTAEDSNSHAGRCTSAELVNPVETVKPSKPVVERLPRVGNDTTTVGVLSERVLPENCAEEKHNTGAIQTFTETSTVSTHSVVKPKVLKVLQINPPPSKPQNPKRKVEIYIDSPEMDTSDMNFKNMKSERKEVLMEDVYNLHADPSRTNCSDDDAVLNSSGDIVMETDSSREVMDPEQSTDIKQLENSAQHANQSDVLNTSCRKTADQCDKMA